MERKLAKVNFILIGMFILSQPFIVMFQATIVRDVQLFGLSVFEGFNLIVTFASVCLTIIGYPNKKVFLKYIPYVLVLGVYLLLHGYHIYQFDQSVYEAQNPNFFVESYYIVRTFVVPLLLLFVLYYSGITKEQIMKVLEIFVFTIVVVLVLTNLFYVAQRNYVEETIYNTRNLFDWFTFENNAKFAYYRLTTKGWFLSGNQLSAILFMSFPIIIYRAYKLRDWFRYLLVFLQMLAMFMVGTKVANVGCLLIAMMFIGLWIFFKVLKHKEKSILVLVAITLFFGALLPFSPIGHMVRYKIGGPQGGSSGLMLDGALSLDIDEEEMDEEQIRYYENLKRDSKIFKKLDADVLDEEQKAFVLQYMKDYCGFFGISPFIIENYADADHAYFWTNYLQKTPNNDYRVLKTMIFEDICRNNDNPLDKYLGLGYTLNYIYTEADYTHQFYSYGLLGVLVLIGPYFWALVYALCQAIRKFKDMFTLESAMYFSAPVLGLCVAKFSGHVLERQLPLLVVGMVMSIILIHTRNINEHREMQS